MTSEIESDGNLRDFYLFQDQTHLYLSSFLWLSLIFAQPEMPRQIYVNNHSKSFILYPQCPDFRESSKSKIIDWSRTHPAVPRFPSSVLILPVCPPNLCHVISIFSLHSTSPQFGARPKKEAGPAEIAPEISITSNYIFGSADSLFWANQVICPCTTTKISANVF